VLDPCVQPVHKYYTQPKVWSKDFVIPKSGECREGVLQSFCEVLLFILYFRLIQGQPPENQRKFYLTLLKLRILKTVLLSLKEIRDFIIKSRL